jgi:hypothetical protein
MATLLLMLDELLLKMSLHLNNAELCHLALVCRKTRSVAQKVLRTHPKLLIYYHEISGCYPGPELRLFKLARMLLEQPPLAARVKGLSLTVGYNISEVQMEEEWEWLRRRRHDHQGPQRCISGSQVLPRNLAIHRISLYGHMGAARRSLDRSPQGKL